ACRRRPRGAAGGWLRRCAPGGEKGAASRRGRSTRAPDQPEDGQRPRAGPDGDGYGQLWTALFVLPLLTAVQEASARLGAVTGRGLAAVMRERYGVRLVYAVIALLLLANTINIGADIGAMGAAAHLLVPLPALLLTVIF